MIDENQLISEPNVFYTFIFNGYRTMLVMGIRRQLKINKESISLLGLLTDVNRNKEIVAKKINSVDSKIQHKMILINNCAKAQNSYFTVEQIGKDIKYIKERAKKIEHIADNYIAHIGKKSISKAVAIETSEIEVILKFLEEKTDYYLKVLFGMGFMHTGPKIEGWDTWRKIFETPWIVSDHKCSTH